MRQQTINSILLSIIVLLILGLTPYYAPAVKLLLRQNPYLTQDWRTGEQMDAQEPADPFTTNTTTPPANGDAAEIAEIHRLAQSVNLNWYNLARLSIVKGFFFTLFIGLGTGVLIIFAGLGLGVFLGSVGYVHRAQRLAAHIRTLIQATDIIPRYFIVIILIQFGRNLPEAWKFIFYLLVFTLVQLPEAAQIFELETRQICQKPYFTMAKTVGATVRRLLVNYILMLAQPKYIAQFLKYTLYTLFMESALSFLQIGFTLENFFRVKIYTLGYVLGLLLRENLSYGSFATAFPIALATILILGVVILLNMLLSRKRSYA